MEKYPNIIYIITHDTGAYFSCYNSPVKTPNIDRIAKGAKLLNHFCTAPQCSPSRASILTGLMPHSHGLMGLLNEGWTLSASMITLPRILNEAGYSTYLFGFQHEAQNATELGYQHVSDRTEFPYLANDVKPKIIEFIKSQNIEDPPFFASVGFFETHRPFIIDEVHFISQPENVQVPFYLPDTPEYRLEIAEFEGMVRIVDKAVGEILDVLENSPLRDNTIIMFTVDHGWPFPRAKCTLYDPGIRTAFLIYWPGKIDGQKIYSNLISSIDILPTILDLLNLNDDVNIPLQGRSFAPLLLNKPYNPREEIYTELTYHDIGFNGIRAIRTKKWKYILNFASLDILFEIPNDYRDTIATKQYIQNNPNYISSRPKEELYDLENDIEEIYNLALNPKYSDIKSKLKSRLISWLQSTNDPILASEIKMPDKPDLMMW